jgi:hypothetical protein
MCSSDCPQAIDQHAASPSTQQPASFPQAGVDMRAQLALWDHLFYGWMTSLIAFGRKQALDFCHLFALEDEFRGQNALGHFRAAWLSDVTKHGDKAALPQTLAKMYWRDVLLIDVFLTLSVILALTGPAYFINALIEFSAETDASLSKGLLLAFGLFMNENLRSMFMNRYWFHASRLGFKIRSAVMCKCWSEKPQGLSRRNDEVVKK